MRGLAVIAGCCLWATAVAADPDPAGIIRLSASRDQMNWERARDYTFTERREIRRFGKKGKVKSVKSDTFEILIFDRQPFRRKIAHNDQPLDESARRKAEQAQQAHVE